MEELKRIKLFAGCSDESLERLLESPCRRQDYPAGRRMLNPGDPCRALMVLVEGQAEARMMGEEGREVLVDHLKAPMLLAPAFLFANNNVVPVEVTALTDCVVWHINREAFFEFMQQEPTVLRSFLELRARPFPESKDAHFRRQQPSQPHHRIPRSQWQHHLSGRRCRTTWRDKTLAQPRAFGNGERGPYHKRWERLQEVLNSKDSHIFLNRTNPANAEVLDQDFGHIG